MTAALAFDQIRLPPECDTLREEVRAFLADEVAAGTFDPHRAGHGDQHSQAFSRRIGAKGWIGMTLGQHWNTLGIYFHRSDAAIGVVILAAGVWYVRRHLKYAKNT